MTGRELDAVGKINNRGGWGSLPRHFHQKTGQVPARSWQVRTRVLACKSGAALQGN